MSCAIDYGDYDMPECYGEITRKARKEHKCCECGRGIAPGEKYTLRSGKWDGEWQEFKSCNDCESVSKAFFPRGCVLGELWFELKECFSNVDGAMTDQRIEKLSPEARAKVVELFDKVNGEENE